MLASEKTKIDNIRLLGRLAIFFALLTLVLFLLSGLAFISMRGMYYFEPFYDIEDDTVDVVFVGSSNAYCAFSPIRLYEKTGLSAQVFGSSNQSCAADYLWAKEAYEAQKYRVLVVEVGSFMNPYGEPKRNIEALNSMKKGKNYFELLRIHGVRGVHVIFPVFYFHDLWRNINNASFAKQPNGELDTFRGYYPIGSHYKEEKIRIIDSEYELNNQLNLEYIDKLLDFCEEKDILPIFVKTTTATDDAWPKWWHDAVASFAETRGVTYIDFNTQENLDAAGILPIDLATDGVHLNISGAHKTTDYIGQYLIGHMERSFTLYDSEDDISEEKIREYYAFMDKVWEDNK
ncbi:MAG: hypothetical protein K6E32_06960 [Lachnospiraceae bacterium]|nr:hypothetical protein [Lachnospiraceae bacterium]